ncbi:MAG: helix-turn-helix transcriptional regulator [Prevotellaceae bacterium]|nr:helix-turn-helix transcriptional regulator [Prevotellaceae bacterium]MDD7421281.1 helix-turn-helix transcriptional regulator [Prevotellaceae bacterium]
MFLLPTINHMHNEIKESITTREKEILGLLAQGMNSKEISEQLFISHHTVEYHRRQLLKKTNSRNIAQLIGTAYRTGILQTPFRSASSEEE